MGIPYDPGAYTFEQILAKLVARRGDIAISPELDMVKLLKQDEFRGKLEILPTPFMITNNYLAFNRAYYQGSTMYVEAIWNEIKRLRASKEWQIMAPKLVQ
jgi:ABC-type amino acid transport substrate-binding protein